MDARPANHKGVGRRPNDSRTHKPATNIVGPAKAHIAPKAADQTPFLNRGSSFRRRRTVNEPSGLRASWHAQ